MTATLLNASHSNASHSSSRQTDLSQLERSHPDSAQLTSLLNGEILLTTQPHTDWGAAVTAIMHLPLELTATWHKLTDYSRWVQYLPVMSRSEVLTDSKLTDNRLTDSSRLSDGRASRVGKRLYQVASKNFLLFTAQVDICLHVIETAPQRVQFYLEKGSFRDFSADLFLQDCSHGTLLTYAVKATPAIPVPSMLIQQAIQMDLPANLRNMRRVMCK